MPALPLLRPREVFRAFELRYTHWAADRSQVDRRPIFSFEPRNRDDVLVGVSF